VNPVAIESTDVVIPIIDSQSAADNEPVMKAKEVAAQEIKAPVLLTFSPPVRQGGARSKPPPSFLASKRVTGPTGAQVPKPESSIAPKHPHQQKRSREVPSTPLPAATSGTLQSAANFTPASSSADLRSPEEIVAALTKRQQIKLASGLLSPRHMLELGIINDDPSIIQATPGEPPLALNEFGIVSVKKKKSSETTDFVKSAAPEDKSAHDQPLSTAPRSSVLKTEEKLVFEFSPGPLRNRKAAKAQTFKVSRAISKHAGGVIAPPALPSLKSMAQQGKPLQRSASSSSVISATASTATQGSTLKHISELKAKDYREANVDQKWKVFETEMNTEAGRLIEQEFPLYKQINTIMDVFYKNKEKLELTTEFLDMYNKIQDIRVNITASLESYKDAPKAEVISKEEERMFFEKYNQQHLNINDEPVDIQPVE
jgi:hypothetical protein